MGDPSVCTKDGVNGPAVGGADDVFVNGLSVTRLRDGGLYPLSCDHAGVPWHAVEGIEQVRVNGRELVATALWTAHAHSRGVTIDGSADVFVGGAVVNLFERARADGIRMLDNAEASLLRWNDEDRANFRRWYGDDSEAARAEILAKIQMTRNALVKPEIRADVGDDYAHVKPSIRA